MTIDWTASTPEGAQLGKQAAESVTLAWTRLPWWTFPAEPLRWLAYLTNCVPHSFYQAAFFLLVSVLLALWTLKRSSLRAGLAVGATAGMTLMGGHQVLEQVYTFIPHGYRWVVPAGAPFRLANLHAHSQASGGTMMPEDLVRWHLEKGYSVVAITDSNRVYGAVRAQEEVKRLGWPILVVPGEEYRGEQTHLLILNLPVAIRADQVPLPEAIARARAQGALVIVAHPWTSKYTPDQLLGYGAQGFECFSPFTRVEAPLLALCKQRHLPELGDLDVRGGNEVRSATVLPLSADTPLKVQQALERGDCAAVGCPDIAEDPHFDFFSRASHNLPDFWKEGGRLLLPGLLFWWLLSLPLRKLPSLPRARPNLWLTLVLGLTLTTGILGVWSVWWKFKLGWFPRIELALWVWVFSCPVSIYLSWQLARSEAKCPIQQS